MTISVTIDETATYVTIDEINNTVTLDQSDNPVTITTTTDVLLPASFAADVIYNETTTLPGGNVQDALADLAEQFFKQSATPSGSNLEEGDLWYDTANEELFVYRQITGGYEWHVIASAGGSSATAFTLDGGSF